MKIYFANNKYLLVNAFREKFYRGHRYLIWTLENSSLSVDNLLKLFNDTSILNKITITDNDNNVVHTYDNVYKSIYRIDKDISSDNIANILIYLSSSEDGLEDSSELEHP